MDGSNDDYESVIETLMWNDLEIQESGRVTINELGRYLRQNAVDVSNFTILRLVSDGQTPQNTMDYDLFIATKEKLLVELSNQSTLDPDEKKKKYRAHFLDQWKEYSHSKDESGEISISELPNVVFAECNPSKDLLDALIEIKNDGSESLNFEEFCEMLDNLPMSGMIDENLLLKAFQTEDMDASGYISRSQLYSLLIENGSDPLSKEEVDEMMEDCGDGERFKYSDWIQRVIALRSQSEK